VPRISTIGIILLATLSLMTSAALTGAARAKVAGPCEALEKWALFVDGEPADAFVARLRGNQPEIQEFIKSLEIGLAVEELSVLLRRIDAAPEDVIEVPEALRGINGFSTTLLLNQLLLGVHPTLYGKIRDYIFIDKTKSGHISVDMCIDRREFYHWDIAIREDGFHVERRTEPTDPSDFDTYPADPFPAVDLALPEAAVDPDDERSIWARGLTHKLHAAGTRIEVRHVYRRKLGAPDLARLDSGHRFYQASEASCVDLFTTGYPPATFGELVRKDYCLGRCTHPAIVNTGGG